MKSDDRKTVHVVALLSDFLEGDLSDRDYVKVESHLAECAACSQVFNQLKQTIEQIGRLPRRMPP
jgi:predicted anti-sigma-YlaC factor YlaD